MKNLKNRKQNLNNLFNIIDTEEKAYWLGFLYADGCIHESGIRLALSIIDKNHIEKLHEFFNKKGKISYLKEKPFNSKNLKYICKAQIVYDLNDVGCLEILSKYGLCKNKTQYGKLNLTLIPFELQKHFWRGMIDGDGCIYYNEKTKRGGMQLTGSYDTLLNFQEFIKKTLNKDKNIVKDKTIFTIKLRENLSKELCEIIYKDSSVYLERKYKKALIFLNTEFKYSHKKIILERNKEILNFETIKKASEFLKVSEYFIKTKNEIDGWKLTNL
jgi:hypothetical protein